MNKYQLLKYAVIGLTLTSRTASLASFIKPEFRTFIQYAEPTKQILIQAGNAYWNYELSQQTLPSFTCRETPEGVLINYERK